MNSLVELLTPELILVGAACVCMLLGVSMKVRARKLAPALAIVALLVVFGIEASQGDTFQWDPSNAVRIGAFAHYIKMITAGIGALLVLVAWPTNRDGTGNNGLNFGQESGEFFGLMLLSLAGVMLVAGANDMILLFLGIELAALPTYVMVSISRPAPVAQEAGVKYFFLGAMAAALLLFGFSYLYGTTGTTDLHVIAQQLRATVVGMNGTTHLTSWQLLAVVILIVGIAFKLAAFPLHFYVGDVYQGAATPVTAFLAFVPKTSGMVALLKILFAIGGGAAAGGIGFDVPPVVAKLIWAIAIATMSVGNMLGLLQSNVKRVFAYSSVAHSGYMLVGVAALLSAQGNQDAQAAALTGILFYLAAYGLMNTGAFGVLTLLPAREARAGSSAETFDDLAGQGRKNVGLGLAMAVSCFSLIGIPLTVGFFGKLLLIKPALSAKLYGLVVITMINAAISAAYYLRIVGSMFLRQDAGYAGNQAPIMARLSLPVTLAVILSAGGTLAFGTLFQATELLGVQAQSGALGFETGTTPKLAEADAPVLSARK